MPFQVKRFNSAKPQHRHLPCCHRFLHTPHNGFLLLLQAFAIACICLPITMDAASVATAKATTLNHTNIKTDTLSKASLSSSPHSTSHVVTTGANREQENIHDAKAPATPPPASAAAASASVVGVDGFSSHTVIYPKIHHARHKRELRHTLDTDGLHVPHITLTYHHKGQRILIDLKRNDDLLPNEHFLRYQNSNTKDGYVVQNFTKTDVDLCHYQGSIRDKPQSYVAVSTCHGGVNGVVFDGIDTYFIHTGSDGQLEDEHLLLRHSDYNKNSTCGYDHEHRSEKQNFLRNVAENKISDVANHVDGAEFNRILRHKRSYDDSNMIRGPYNSNKHSSYVEIVIVVDNKAYKSFNENMKKVHQHCIKLANIMNALYVPLNIFIALVGVVIWNESNEIEITPDADATLRNFLNYRRTKLVLEHPNDSAQLLTKINFDESVVGKAFKDLICTYEFSGSVNVEHSPVPGVVATTMAHELGHNFGMDHDTSDCKCQDEKCIMSSSSTSVLPVHWSSCSIDQLNIAFSRGMNYCLRNKPAKLFDSPQCGNSFVEPGEQCDCGLPNYCENACCDPYTCMLHTNASCATGECCDLSTCRPKVAGTQCRYAENECDLPEYCTGESEYCPLDVFKRDTEECDNGQAYCFQGNCRSHSYQCRILWGPTGENSEPCYAQMNIQGKRVGNCGYNRLNDTYIPCEEENALCGMLHCRHLNERLEFGMERAAVMSHSFITYENDIVPCRTALVDLGLQSTDPGLTPNGAKCGDNKMCVDQKCLAIEQLKQTGMGKECPEYCSGNGICNSKGHCHCNIGFTGPTCKLPGAGGSIDSGPATNPNSHEAFQRFLYIFFFAVVPCMAAFCFFMYYCRHHPIFVGGKLAENMYVSTPNKHGFSFSTSSYTSVTPHSTNNCKDLNSSVSTPSFTASSSSFKISSPKKPNGVNRKPPPGALKPDRGVETETLTASNTATTNHINHINNSNNKTKNNNNNNNNNHTRTLPIIKSKYSIAPSVPPLSPYTTQKLKQSSSNDNLHKIKNNLRKTNNMSLSKSHDEIATATKTTTTTSQTNKIHIKPPTIPPPITAHKPKLKKSNSSCTSNASHKVNKAFTTPPSSSSSSTNQNSYNSKTLQNPKRTTGDNSNANVNTLKRKFEITEVRLNSTTNPHALVDGTTYTVTDQTNSIKSASGAKQPPSGRGPNGNIVGQVNANGLPKSTPSSTDDMNSALLKSPSDSNDMGNGMFGKFKGFTLRPLNDATSPTNNLTGPNVAYVQPTLQDNSVPQRAAPPPPIKQNDGVKMNGTLARKAPPPPYGISAPALPPPNPGSSARPIISMPLPLKTPDIAPVRPAPMAPGEVLKSAPPPPVPLHADPKLNVKRDGTLRRITSFLKKDEKQPAKEKTYIDREKLKNLEISAPIPMQTTPQGESSNSDSELTPKEEETKNLVKRAQSMRSPTKKGNIQTFGSMRQASGPAGSSRPRSAVSSQTLAGQRPKSPPPRPPALKKTNSTTSSGYQLPISGGPKAPEHMYDDCEFSEVSLSSVVEQDSPQHRASDVGDDIYSVIDEIPPAAQTLKRTDLVGSQRNSVASANDLGLLGEIVNEIEKRNGADSIYSAAASSLVKGKPKEEVKKIKKEDPKESCSISSKPPVNPSTYLRPAPVNAPIARVAPTRSDLSPTTAFSSFKPSPATVNASTTNNNNNNNNATTITTAQNRYNTTTASKAKSFTKPATQKSLPPQIITSQNQNSTTKVASATITKPKPLSAKPSFSSHKKAAVTAPTVGSIKQQTAAAAAGTTAKATRPSIGSAKTDSSVASLAQRFEQPKIANNGTTATATSLRK